LVYDGREIVKSQYCSLLGQRVYGGYSELTISMFVSVKNDGLGKVWKTDLVNFDSFGHRKPCWEDLLC